MPIHLRSIALVAAVAFTAGMLSSLPATAAEAPEPRSRSEIEAVLAKAPKPPAEEKLRNLNIVLVAFKKDHGPEEHDYPLWQKRWSLLLGGQRANIASATQVNLYGPPTGKSDEVSKGAPKVHLSTATGWPSKEQLRKADLIVMFCYGRWNDQKINDLKEFLSRGGGFVAVHPAVITNKELSLKVANLIGLAWEDGYTRWRHGPMDLKITARDHPICLGLPETIHLVDEAYWPLKGERSEVEILATSNEKIRKDTAETRPEPMFYMYRCGKGRVFSCILGHYTWTFDDPYFRILLLRGMAWAAGESSYRFDSLVLRGIPLSGETP